MKKCPSCQQVFDDSNDFCLNDGTPLVRITASAFDTPTQIFQTPGRVTAQTPTKGTSPFLYLVIGVLATAFGAALIFIYATSGRNEDAKRGENGNSTTAKESPAPSPPAGSQNVAFAQVVPSRDPTLTPTGNWNGAWAGKAADFTAAAYLVEKDGKVDGRIVWTLQRSSNPQRMYKAGSVATEYVRGSFDATTCMVALAGYRKDDPNNIIILDSYSLKLSDDKQTLDGRSKNGVFTLRR